MVYNIYDANKLLILLQKQKTIITNCVKFIKLNVERVQYIFFRSSALEICATAGVRATAARADNGARVMDPTVDLTNKKYKTHPDSF